MRVYTVWIRIEQRNAQRFLFCFTLLCWEVFGSRKGNTTLELSAPSSSLPRAVILIRVTSSVFRPALNDAREKTERFASDPYCCPRRVERGRSLLRSFAVGLFLFFPLCRFRLPRRIERVPDGYLPVLLTFVILFISVTLTCYFFFFSKTSVFRSLGTRIIIIITCTHTQNCGANELLPL